MSYLVLDIETVPDEDTFVPPPRKPVPEGEEKPMLPPYAHRVCAIGCLLLGNDFEVVRLGAIMNTSGKDGEREALVSWSEYMNRTGPTIVSWNGRGFDLPVLLARCFRLGVSCPWYFESKYGYRYSEADHCDLLDQLIGYGAVNRTGYRLDAWAKIIGLPGKPDDVDGGQVAELAAKGKWKLIEEYCLTDVEQTAFLFLRWKLLRGEIDVAKHDEAANGLWKHFPKKLFSDKKLAVPLVGDGSLGDK